MPGWLGSQQRKRTIPAGNSSAAGIPYDCLTGSCTAIETEDQRGRVFHSLALRKPKAFQVKQPLRIELWDHELITISFEDQIDRPRTFGILDRAINS